MKYLAFALATLSGSLLANETFPNLPPREAVIQVLRAQPSVQAAGGPDSG